MSEPHQPGDPWKIPKYSWRHMLNNKGVTLADLKNIASIVGCTKVSRIKNYDTLVRKLTGFADSYDIPKIKQRRATHEICLRSKLLRKEGNIPNFILVDDEDEGAQLKSYLEMQGENR